MCEKDTYEYLVSLKLFMTSSPTRFPLDCLCSRSIQSVPMKKCEIDELNDLSNKMSEDGSPTEDCNTTTDSQPSSVSTIKMKEQDDGVCCSTSHYSTDDSTRDILQSDSGTDVSEPPRDLAWEDYWAEHGNSIIMQTWNEKYGNCIDTMYSKENSQTSSSSFDAIAEGKHESNDATRLSFGSEVSDSLTNVTSLTLSELSAEESSLLSSADSASCQSTDASLWLALWENHISNQYQIVYESYLASLNSDEVMNQNTIDPEFNKKKNIKNDKVKNAFNLIGCSYNGDGVSSGTVEYHKKNIRSQNKRLHLNKHFYFDDKGIAQEYPETDKQETSNEFNISEHCDKNSDDSSDKDDSSEDQISLEVSEPLKERKKVKKENKRKRKRKGVPKEIHENEELYKYWLKRYRLFSRFDDGIKLDKESWYSVTPEKIAIHTAERCRSDVIIDAFCGAGGNAIQFAFTCEMVIAIDIDPVKIEIARHNARIYEVEDRIEFIVGDFIKLAPYLKADVVFLSPPWGGVKYNSEKSYPLSQILHPIGGSTLYQIASKITPDVAMFLPRNICTDDLMALAGPAGVIELEQNCLGKKLISLTAYFGTFPYSLEEYEEYEGTNSKME